MKTEFEQEIESAPLPPSGALTDRALTAWAGGRRPRPSAFSRRQIALAGTLAGLCVSAVFLRRDPVPILVPAPEPRRAKRPAPPHRAPHGVRPAVATAVPALRKPELPRPVQVAVATAPSPAVKKGARLQRVPSQSSEVRRPAGYATQIARPLPGASTEADLTPEFSLALGDSHLSAKATLPRGLNGPQTLLVAVYDTGGALLGVARADGQPGAEVDLDFGRSLDFRRGEYFQCTAYPTPRVATGALEEITGWQAIGLTPQTVAASVLAEPSALTLGAPSFLQRNVHHDTEARLVATLERPDRRTDRVSAALYDEKGRLVGVATTTVEMTHQMIAPSREISLDFGRWGGLLEARRYQFVANRLPAIREKQIPILGDLPIIGNLFRQRPEAEAAPTPAVRERLEKLRDARAKRDNQRIYELCIGTEFDRIVIEAATAGDEASVAELIQQAWLGGPDAAPKGGNGVTWAAYYPTVEPVKRLLDRGVAPGVGDENGVTGLHRTYREEIARLLIEKGAPLEAKSKSGETPLIAQARQANPWMGRGILALLVQKGANHNAADNDGKTALMHAAKSGMVADVEALLRAGADPERTDNAGKRARDYVGEWAWQRSPGLATEESLAAARRQAEADRRRIEELLALKR